MSADEIKRRAPCRRTDDRVIHATLNATPSSATMSRRPSLQEDSERRAARTWKRVPECQQQRRARSPDNTKQQRAGIRGRSGARRGEGEEGCRRRTRDESWDAGALVGNPSAIYPLKSIGLRLPSTEHRKRTQEN